MQVRDEKGNGDSNVNDDNRAMPFITVRCHSMKYPHLIKLSDFSKATTSLSFVSDLSNNDNKNIVELLS